MSDTGRDLYLIPDDAQANYRAVRIERNWTWIEMAEEFERQAEATVIPDRSYLRLAMWARAEALDAGELDVEVGPAEREGTTPDQPTRERPGKRTTKAEPAPHRTADVDDADPGVPIAV